MRHEHRPSDAMPRLVSALEQAEGDLAQADQALQRAQERLAAAEERPGDLGYALYAEAGWASRMRQASVN